MLGIDGHEPTGLRRIGHDELTTHDERLLVREGQRLARLNGGQAHAQTDGAHQGIDHHVDVFQGAETGRGVVADRKAVDRQLLESGRDLGRRALERREREMPHAEFPRLIKQIGSARARSEGDDLDAIGVTAGNVERLNADGARRAENGDAPRRRSTATRHKEHILPR